MKYIFHKDSDKGEYPVASYLLTCYDMTKEGNPCFDEQLIKAEDFDPHKYFTFLDTEENNLDLNRFRVFAEMKNGSLYELILKKVNASEDINLFK